MKKILIIGLLVACNFMTNAQQAVKMNITELENYIASREHPAVVNFWATWCAPCLEEMPWIYEAVKKFSDDKVELVLVSLDNIKAFPEKINAVLQQKKINATLIWLNETDADYFCPKIDPGWSGSIPATLFVNKEKSRRKFIEEQIPAPQLKKELNLLTQ